MIDTTTSDDAPESLSGSIERITFHSEDNGFCVLKVHVRGHTDLVTITGRAVAVHVGEHIRCQGQWVNDVRHGRQFSATQLHIVPPTTLAGIERYLASGLIKGVGEHYAKKLIDAFGEQVFDVIEHEPERLHALPGMGKKRCKQIIRSFAEHTVVRDIMVFLQSHGIGSTRAVRIYKTYGDNALDVVRANPYNLAKDIHGIGFKTADELALSLGIEHNSVLRAQAGIRYLLQTYANRGHCAVAQQTLIAETAKLLTIDVEVIQQGLIDEIEANRVMLESIDQAPCVFLAPLFHAERAVANHIIRLLHGRIPWGRLTLEKVLPWVEAQTGLALSPSQQSAIQTVLSSKVTIMTGGPGVGKTTVVNSILRIIRTAHLQVVLCAPTGRAAKRLSETTGLTAKTIHRLLEFDPRGFNFKRDESRPLVGDLFVIDEASMVDIVLMSQLLRALPQHAGLLIVGDVDQLPSVGPGAVLADLIASSVIPTACLTDIFRQAADSQIIVNAHRINQGELPLSPTDTTLSDFYFISAKTPEDIHDKVIELVTKRIPARFRYHPIHDIQVLTPMNRASLGTQSLNSALQAALNPDGQPRIQRYGMTLAVGDKVIQTVNNYDKDIYNGDIGQIVRINLHDKTVTVHFDDRPIEYNWQDCDEINLAYATTIHKSQGSEYPVVVMPLSMQHYNLLQRNLVYTGITRGKQLVVLVGQSKALNMAVHNHHTDERLTYLTQRLAGWE